MELLWSWSKEYSLDDYGVSYLRLDKCIDFETEIYFKLGKSMLKKHRSVFQDHVKYIHNDILKPLRVGILHYDERFQ